MESRRPQIWMDGSPLTPLPPHTTCEPQEQNRNQIRSKIKTHLNGNGRNRRDGSRRPWKSTTTAANPIAQTNQHRETHHRRVPSPQGPIKAKPTSKSIGRNQETIFAGVRRRRAEDGRGGPPKIGWRRGEKKKGRGGRVKVIGGRVKLSQGWRKFRSPIVSISNSEFRVFQDGPGYQTRALSYIQNNILNTVTLCFSIITYINPTTERGLT